jgi:hypothetical protein
LNPYEKVNKKLVGGSIIKWEVTNMQLVVFDLDTALCQTSAMDGLAMSSAIKDVANCQIEPESIQSIHDLKAIWYRATHRVATAIELAELRSRFAFHLRRQFLIRPSIVAANYALVEQVNMLQHKPKTVVALVSSHTTPVLQMKTRAIGLLSDSLPVSTGDDADSLDGILQSIQTRVKRSYGFKYEESTLIASCSWREAAASQNMKHVLPADYIVPPEHFHAGRTASRFGWTRF